VLLAVGDKAVAQHEQGPDAPASQQEH